MKTFVSTLIMKKLSFARIIPVLAAFFVMGFCDIVGITSDYVQQTFGWSSTMTGFVPSMVFLWFLFLGIPVGNLMNRWGRKRTVLLGMTITVAGMFLPLIVFSGTSCMAAFALLGVGNAVLQVSLNPLLGNVVHDERWLASCLTAGQVIKACSSLVGPEIVLWAVTRFGTTQWYFCFPILGFVTLLFAFWLSVTPIMRETQISNRVSVTASLSLLKNQTILRLFLGIFFVVGVDVSINYIGSKLMIARFDWPLEQAKFVPQLYFLCRTVGALLGTLLLARMSALRYYRIHIVACLIPMLGLILYPESSTANLFFVGAIGFFASSIFSVIYSLAFEEMPSRMNEISGLMITAVAGGGVITPIIGYAIDRSGMTGGLTVILCCMFYLVYCAFVIGRRR